MRISRASCSPPLAGVNYFFRRVASLDEATRPAVMIAAGHAIIKMDLKKALKDSIK